MPGRDRERTPGSGGITEAENPRTRDLDRLPLREVLERIVDEDAQVPDAVRGAIPELEQATEILLDALRSGGRWLNLGAGTSGRIGVSDAAEIPPTFGIPPDRVQGVIAGGTEALTRAVEGAEDDPDAGAADLSALGLTRDDVVVALSASGRTPYVLGGVRHARDLGARTIGVTCNPEAPLLQEVDHAVVVRVGAEVIAGSTRMKGGIAEKMVLHALSTAVMVRLGRVRGNLMTEICGVNSKLRARAVRTLARLGRLPLEEAERRLVEAKGSLRDAIDRLDEEES